MKNVRLRVKSCFDVPMPAKSSASSSDQSVLTASVATDSLHIEALKVGTATISLTMGSDFSGQLVVEVVT